MCKCSKNVAVLSRCEIQTTFVDHPSSGFNFAPAHVDIQTGEIFVRKAGRTATIEMSDRGSAFVLLRILSGDYRLRISRLSGRLTPAALRYLKQLLSRPAHEHHKAFMF